MTFFHQASLATLVGGIELATHEAQPLKAGAKPKEKKETRNVKEAVPKAKKETSPNPQESIAPEIKKGLTPQSQKEKSPQPKKEKSQPKKEKSPQPQKEKSLQPKKEKSPQSKKEKIPQPKKEKTPQPEKEKAQPQKPSKGCESKEVIPKSEEVKPTIENKKAGPMDHLPLVRHYYCKQLYRFTLYICQGSFDLEAWKRFYSNNDEESSCDYFWREFDSSCYSIWRGDYRFNSELNQVLKVSSTVA